MTLSLLLDRTFGEFLCKVYSDSSEPQCITAIGGNGMM